MRLLWAPLLMASSSLCFALPEPVVVWVHAHPLLVRAAPTQDASVIGRLQQGSAVSLIGRHDNREFCQVTFDGAAEAYVACRHLSVIPVVPRRAGEAGVSADLRWVAGSSLLVRSEPRPDAEVTGRLSLNAEMRLRPAPPQQGYCEVETIAPPSLVGFVACRYLLESPVALERIGVPFTPDREPNPEFRPRQAFAIAPSWTYLGRYEMQQASLCAEGGRCTERDVDHEAELLRMRKQLHGQLVAERAPASELRTWDQLQRVGPLSWALALQLPTASPSWFRSTTELADPHSALAELATQFDAQQRWYVGALIKPDWVEARVERLTRALWRVELISGDVLRAREVLPEHINRRWLPDTEFFCMERPFGFQHGDVDAATAKRDGMLREPGPGPLLLMWFHSLRPLPAKAPRIERSTVRFDRVKSGFSKAEMKRFDLDGDEIPDLLYLEVSGHPPGMDPAEPPRDDPWQRVLLVNIQGRWYLLGYDEITYHDGC